MARLGKRLLSAFIETGEESKKRIPEQEVKLKNNDDATRASAGAGGKGGGGAGGGKPGSGGRGGAGCGAPGAAGHPVGGHFVKPVCAPQIRASAQSQLC